jgi:DNA-binding NarL/FixJ family response regulator
MMDEIRKYNVIVADDHSIFRVGLMNILSHLPVVSRIDEASNGMEVLKLLKKRPYDIVFMDIEMPVLNGIDTLQKIRALQYPVKIITLSMFSSENYIMAMYDQEVNGYILKNTNHQELNRAIDLVMDNQQYYCPEVANILFKRLIKKEKPSEKDEIELSEREEEILLLICQQFSSTEIGERLCISEKTVKRHRQKLIEKTGMKNLAGLVIFAIKKGYIRID